MPNLALFEAEFFAVFKHLRPKTMVLDRVHTTSLGDAMSEVLTRPEKFRPNGKYTAETLEHISIEMLETDDVLAKLGQRKGDRFVVGFALEADNPREGALQKLRTKHCDAVVLNGPAAIGSDENSIELIDGSGAVVGAWDGPKNQLATHLIEWIEQRWSIATR